jgi:hypothetical protein
VRQREAGRGAHVVGGHLVPAGPGGQRHGGLGGDQVGAQAVDVERGAHGGDLAQCVVAQHDARQALPGGGDLRCQLGVVVGPPRGERGRVGLVRHPAADHLGPLRRVARGGDLDGEPEPVEQLRAQLALLGVHGAHQQEACGVPDRHPLALHVGGAERRGVEQQVDQVVVQQVDLVDVEDAAVRCGQQARLVGAHPLGERALEVERADEAVLRRTHRQLDEPRRTTAGLDVRACGPSGQAGSGSAGSHEKRHPSTTDSAGSSAASARTTVDFAVPFSPRTSTPPTDGETALTTSARRRSSRPTTAENG